MKTLGIVFLKTISKFIFSCCFCYQDIEEFINDSPNGVVYFTFGSTIRMNTAPMYLQMAFIEALGELQQKVIWKYESKAHEKLMKNVMIRKWFPQRDILGLYLNRSIQ